MEKHVHSIDNEKVKDIDILQVDTIYEMATLFKMFADPTKAKEELEWVATKTLEDMCRDSWNFAKNVE